MRSYSGDEWGQDYIAGQAQLNESWEAHVTEAQRVRTRIKNES